ncbi:MAG: FlgD immunoglobulin-like domain containing protein [Bacteroidota bacterium]
MLVCTIACLTSGYAQDPFPRPCYTPQANLCGAADGPQFPEGIDAYDLTRACRTHDLCYGGCNTPKGTCDENFYSDMLGYCMEPGNLALSAASVTTPYPDCFTMATTFYGLVNTSFADVAYEHAQDEACIDCGALISISGAGTRTYCKGEEKPKEFTLTASGPFTCQDPDISWRWSNGSTDLSVEVKKGRHVFTVKKGRDNECKKRVNVKLKKKNCDEDGNDTRNVEEPEPMDPNDITGILGFDSLQWVSPRDVLGYKVRFENDPVLATAPAQNVYITVPIDSSADLLSFRLGDFGFGSFYFSPPENSAYLFQQLDVRDSLGVLVNVTAGIDVNAHEAFWFLESIDPVTGLAPQDALVGFLPVNDQPSDTIVGRGEGFVNFSIAPSANAQTGETILEQASIVFDVNAPILTNIWMNTIDAYAPMSQISTPSQTIDTTAITLSWQADDDFGGVGLAQVDIYVAEDSGEFSLYQSITTEDSSLIFTGEAGKTYHFYTIAEDHVNNREGFKVEPDASIRFLGLGTALVSGTAISELGDTIPDVQFSLSGFNGNQIQTDPAFSFLIHIGSQQEIGAFKNNDTDRSNGVDVADLLLLTREMMGSQVLSTPYQRIAANVDHDSDLDSEDMDFSKALILDEAPGFFHPVSPMTQDYLWSFVPSDFVFANPVQPFAFDTSYVYSAAMAANQQDFIGIRLGDVNNSWNQDLLPALDSLSFLFEEANVPQNQLFEVPVRVENFSSVAGFQFTLQWDPAVLRYNHAWDDMLDVDLGLKGIQDGNLTVLWTDPNALGVDLMDSSLIFTLEFEAIGMPASQSGITITSSRTRARGYDAALDLLGIQSQGAQIVVDDPIIGIEDEWARKYQFEVRPNPFEGQTRLQFSLPQAEEVQISILNELGQMIWSKEGRYEQGIHHLMWNGHNRSGQEVAEGIYFVKLESEGFHKSLKVQKLN